MLTPLCHYALVMLTQSFPIMQSQLLFITFSCYNIAWNIDCVNESFEDHAKAIATIAMNLRICLDTN